MIIVWLLPGKADPEEMINLKPFQTIHLYVTAWTHGYAPTYIIIGNLLGNIFLFIPLGHLLFVHLRHLGSILLIFISIYIPVYIEIVQLLLYLTGYGTRSIDIDDVLLNMIGIWLGYFIRSLLLRQKLS